MKIIISPAKKMNVVPDILPYKDLPVFINQADRLKQELQRIRYQNYKSCLPVMRRLRD